MENRLGCQNYDILAFWRGKTTLWRQIWRQISWNSQKRHSNVRMPTNDRIELKTCMDTYFHPRNAMVVSEYLYFDLMKAKTILWHQIWRQISWNSQKCHSNDVRIPTNDRIVLKTCTATYFHPRNAMVVSELWYFDFLEG